MGQILENERGKNAGIMKKKEVGGGRKETTNNLVRCARNSGVWAPGLVARCTVSAKA
jgi:hypothetical protein